MTTPESIPDILDDALGSGGVVPFESLDETFADQRAGLAAGLESDLGVAGWYETSADPYPAPTTPVDAPPSASPPILTSVRSLWLATYKPGHWVDPGTGLTTSDVFDEHHFPWSHPETAAAQGNFWLSTAATPQGRPAIEAINVGDLVIVQRSDPGAANAALRTVDGKPHGATSLLAGVAVALAAETWDDADTGRRERRVSLVPAARFEWPVPRVTARRHQRLRGDSFRNRPQLPDGTGPVGFTLSAVIGPDVTELLAVCGIHPEALADPDLNRVFARLKATAVGNRALWRYRYDHVLRHAIRTRHEVAAVEACKRAAAVRRWTFWESAERQPNAGYDLIFRDAARRTAYVEVKGYETRVLSDVHLQPSQARRARAAAARPRPDWFLYTLLGVNSQNPDESWHTARRITHLLDTGGIQVKRAPATSPGRCSAGVTATAAYVHAVGGAEPGSTPTLDMALRVISDGRFCGTWRRSALRSASPPAAILPGPSNAESA